MAGCPGGDGGRAGAVEPLLEWDEEQRPRDEQDDIQRLPGDYLSEPDEPHAHPGGQVGAAGEEEEHKVDQRGSEGDEGEEPQKDAGGGREPLPALEAGEERKVVPQDGGRAADHLPGLRLPQLLREQDSQRALEDISQGHEDAAAPSESAFGVARAHVAVAQGADILPVGQARVEQRGGDGAQQVGQRNRQDRLLPGHRVLH